MWRPFRVEASAKFCEEMYSVRDFVGVSFNLEVHSSASWQISFFKIFLYHFSSRNENNVYHIYEKKYCEKLNFLIKIFNKNIIDWYKIPFDLRNVPPLFSTTALIHSITIEIVQLPLGRTAETTFNVSHPWRTTSNVYDKWITVTFHSEINNTYDIYCRFDTLKTPWNQN